MTYCHDYRRLMERGLNRRRRWRAFREAALMLAVVIIFIAACTIADSI